MENLFYQPGIMQGIAWLDAEESRHCVKVLRKRAGDEIHITDGKGSIFLAKISQATPSQCVFEIKEKISVPTKSHSTHLAIAPTKNTHRMEWMVEKCVELGIDQISLVQTKHTERTSVNLARLEKIAVSALKQSFQVVLPRINMALPFTNFITSCTEVQKFIAHANEPRGHLFDLLKPGGESVVLIGPEGDFTAEEISLAEVNGFVKATLGSSRLRTETAGIATCHIINLINRNN